MFTNAQYTVHCPVARARRLRDGNGVYVHCSVQSYRILNSMVVHLLQRVDWPRVAMKPVAHWLLSRTRSKKDIIGQCLQCVIKNYHAL